MTAFRQRWQAPGIATIRDDGGVNYVTSESTRHARDDGEAARLRAVSLAFALLALASRGLGRGYFWPVKRHHSTQGSGVRVRSSVSDARCPAPGKRYGGERGGCNLQEKNIEIE